MAVGCKTVRPADNPEHEYTVGGKWGFIDKQGNEVVPLQYDASLIIVRLRIIRSLS